MIVTNLQQTSLKTTIKSHIYQHMTWPTVKGQMWHTCWDICSQMCYLALKHLVHSICCFANASNQKNYIIQERGHGITLK